MWNETSWTFLSRGSDSMQKTSESIHGGTAARRKRNKKAYTFTVPGSVCFSKLTPHFINKIFNLFILLLKKVLQKNKITQYCVS
jgi:hypothetical protein